ncbi:MAG: hypothetical protein ACK53T_16170 [Planctomycetota bacterium]|jgi:hypothetical protein
MTSLPLIAQARADLELVGWRLNVLLTLAHELLDVHEYRRVKTEWLVRICGCSHGKAVDALATLTRRGYLDRREGDDGPEYRLYWTRAGQSADRAAPASSPRPAA